VLTRQPHRKSNGLESRPVTLAAQNAIPIEYGKRLHGCSPVCVVFPDLASRLGRRLPGANSVDRKNVSCQEERAIDGPETVRNEYSLEVAGRVRDTRIELLIESVSRYVNLSECWHRVQWTG
jgi:hypothetical protein